MACLYCSSIHLNITRSTVTLFAAVADFDSIGRSNSTYRLSYDSLDFLPIESYIFVLIWALHVIAIVIAIGIAIIITVKISAMVSSDELR